MSAGRVLAPRWRVLLIVAAIGLPAMLRVSGADGVIRSADPATLATVALVAAVAVLAAALVTGVTAWRGARA